MASSSSGNGAPPHYFPTPALDHAFSGIMAGAVATVCMNPLDLVKVQFQVDTSNRADRVKRAGRSSASALSAPSASSANGTSLSTTTMSSSHSPSAWSSMVRKATGGDVVRDMTQALREIVRRDGYSGLYRGLSPNVVGNSASWGLYFLWYTMIKEYMASSDQAAFSLAEHGDTRKLSAGQHLLAASESGAITAMMTNPIWVVKTRMFTTTRSGLSILPPNSQPPPFSSTASSSALDSVSASSTRPGGTHAATAETVRYTGLVQGLRHIWRYEGWKGLYKGAGLALVGVSNGAIQFVCYEELKRWRMKVAQRKEAARRHDRSLGVADRTKRSPAEQQTDTNGGESGEDIKLDNSEYIVMSGAAKLVAITLTYPYQVIRSRIQNHSTAHIYPNIPTCIRLTWQNEGFKGFYKGMTANAIRILPGTCVTFVVYENCSWALRGLAERRNARLSGERQLQNVATT